jgi:predicted ATPase/DNA-binding winged helix-turn-helix (wHTH) protein
VTRSPTPAQDERPTIGLNAAPLIEPDDAPSPQGDIISFGPFRLFPAARALEKNGVPLALGNRALDILMVLVERAGEVVSHRELTARVWRGLVVDPSNLRVHMTGLRRALGDRDGKDRYIANVTGQGYCFVAPVRRETTGSSPTRAPEYPCGAARQRLVLPPVLARMVGREETVRTIAADLIAERFVTIIGPGGMGKTTVAVAVAHMMLEEFADAVCFVDLGAVSDSKLVAATVASSLGLTIQTGDVVPTLLECLRTLRILLVLDNCEHVVDATATLAELTFKETAGVHILATSREALRVEGEHAFWLPPLPSPPPESSLKAADVLTFPAVKLFMERAAASGGRFELNDQTAPIVAGICGRLDGIALAIEFAAGRVGSHGITGTEELLNRSLGLDWQGRRTALPRHQTLRALLDWSYGFLVEPERHVLQRLTIFVGTFSLEAAQAIACTGALNEVRVVDTVDSLVAKSLVDAVIAEGNATRYRLLETTRVYATEKLQESGEASEVAERHAKYFTRLLNTTFGGDIEPHRDGGALNSAEHLGNVRAALAWCFAEADTPSKVKFGVELAAASVPVFLELSLLNECHKWSKVALTSIDDATRGRKCELVLQEALAIASAWTRGTGDDVRAALTRGLALATELGEASSRLRLLVGMHVYLVRIGDFRGSLAIADQLQAAARNDANACYEILSDWMRGSSEHFMGSQTAARDHFQKGFARIGPRNMQLFGLDYRVRALVTFARVLWLSGSPDRALEIAREAIREAALASKPLNVCFALLYTAPVFLWCGDLDSARDGLEKLMAHPNWHALPSLRATGLALKGELLIDLGDTERGTALLSEALESLRADRQSIVVARAACGLAESLAASGQHDDALSVISEAIANASDNGEVLELPELLRIKATILLSTPELHSPDAEDCLVQSLDCARRQSAKSWELRTALTLARVRARQGNREQARQLLAPLYAQFTEGFETGDLKAAREFLLSLAEA